MEQGIKHLLTANVAHFPVRRKIYYQQRYQSDKIIIKGNLIPLIKYTFVYLINANIKNN